MTRGALSLEVPDGTTVPLASNMEYQGANLQAIKMRERVQRDSINYFPNNAHQACWRALVPNDSRLVSPWVR